MEPTKTKTSDCDWCSLPPEVLNIIAKNLCEISDFVRFRTVCKAWRSSTPITDRPPQFPWILDQCGNKFWTEPTLRFYSITSNKIRTIRAPMVLNKWIIGGMLQGRRLCLVHHGWRPTFLLNPLKNDVITVPAFPFHGKLYWVGHQQNEKGDDLICCGCRRPDSKCTFSFFDIGQGNWCGSELTLESNCNFCKHFYLKDMLFTVESDTGVTKVIDITAGSICFTVPRPPDDGPLFFGIIDIVEVSGDILRVRRHSDIVDVHRLDATGAGVPCWVRVKNIGDHALFIDFDGCFALKANSLCGIKENCIYHFDKKFVASPEGDLVFLERIDIKTNVRERLPCPFKKVVCWFDPN